MLFVCFFVSATEEAVGDGDTDEEKVEEFPVSGEERLVDEFRSL